MMYFVFCAFLKLFVEINMKEYVDEGVVLHKVNFFFDWALSVLIILFYCYFFILFNILFIVRMHIRYIYLFILLTYIHIIVKLSLLCLIQNSP